jgi:hypothetical protein
VTDDLRGEAGSLDEYLFQGARVIQAGLCKRAVVTSDYHSASTEIKVSLVPAAERQLTLDNRQR